MRPRKAATLDPGFCLTCRDCVTAFDYPSEEEAAADGWNEFDYAPDALLANYVGLCPDCQERYEHWGGE